MLILHNFLFLYGVGISVWWPKILFPLVSATQFLTLTAISTLVRERVRKKGMNDNEDYESNYANDPDECEGVYNNKDNKEC